MRLRDRVSLITGGGSGIGRATALLFAREGSKVVVADIVPQSCKETVAMIKATGGEATSVEVDVARADQVERMVKCAVERYERINILFNNAGVAFVKEDNLITEVTEEVWDRTIGINLKSTYLCCKYAIPELIKCGGGSIINNASISALAVSERPSYSASKGGIIALTRSLAAQFARNNIRVNAICPGLIDSPMNKAGMKLLTEKPPQFSYPGALLGRNGTAEEIAYSVLFLASDESSYTTGSILVVDGGVSAR